MGAVGAILALYRDGDDRFEHFRGVSRVADLHEKQGVHALGYSPLRNDHLPNTDVVLKTISHALMFQQAEPFGAVLNIQVQGKKRLTAIVSLLQRTQSATSIFRTRRL